MAYASASDVAAMCSQLVSGENNFTSTTLPTITQVERWLSSACAIIESILQSRGYGVPVSATATIYDWIIDLNATYAASKAEMMRTNVIIGMGEKTKGMLYSKQFWDDIEKLKTIDLTQTGIGRSSIAPIYTGGISIADKDAREDDTDRVQPRFKRGQFSFPGGLRPDSSGIYDIDEDT